MPAYDNIIHMAAVCIHFNTIHGSFIFICSFVQSGMASTITYTFYIVKSMVERERERISNYSMGKYFKTMTLNGA